MLNWIDSVFSKKNIYVYKDNHIVATGKKFRKIKSLIQFFISPFSNHYYFETKLVNSVLDSNTPIVYISDEHRDINYYENHITQKYKQKFNHTLLDNESNKKTIDSIVSALKNQEHLFLTSSELVNGYNKEGLSQQFLFALQTLDFIIEDNPQIFLILAFHTNTFSIEEIQNIHACVERLKAKGITSFLSMADYGDILNLKDNIFGSDTCYDEYKIINHRESGLVFQELRKFDTYCFFDKLPSVLKEVFKRDSYFLLHEEEEFVNQRNYAFNKNLKNFYQKLKS